MSTPQGFMSVAELIHFLGRNPMSRKLIARVYELGDTSIITPFHHLHLTGLSIEADNMGPILDALTLPSLEELRLIYPNGTPESGILPKHKILSLVAKSNARLRSLTVVTRIYGQQGISKEDQLEVVTKLTFLQYFWASDGLVDLVVHDDVCGILSRRREWYQQAMLMYH